MFEFSAWYQLAISFAEIGLALWLVSGRWGRAATAVATALFLTFFGYTLSTQLGGRSTCNCLGRLTPDNPWWMVVLDAVAVACSAAAFVLKPSAATRPWLGVGALAFAAAAALVVGAGAVFDPERLTGYTLGRSVIVVPDSIPVGSGKNGEYRNVDVSVRNLTARTVTLVGGTSNCACVATGELPLEIPPGEAVRVPITIQFRGSAGSFRHRLTFYTDDAEHLYVTASFHGVVLPK